MSDPVNFFSPDGLEDPFTNAVCVRRQTELMKLSSTNSRDIFPINGTCAKNTTMEKYINQERLAVQGATSGPDNSINFYVCQLTNINNNDKYIASGLFHEIRDSTGVIPTGVREQCQNLAKKQTGTWTPTICDTSKSLDSSNKWECKTPPQ